MEYEDDFLFEEDKIVLFFINFAHDYATARWHYLMGEIASLRNPVRPKESIEAATLVNISHFKTTVPLANVQLHRLNMMEDRIPDVELIKQDQSTYLLQQHINQMGMTISSGNVIIKKDSSNLIGISIGGGAPLCPCLYIVQVFDNTPAAHDGTLEAGDELVAVNGECLKGKTKVEVAKMIQACDNTVSIIYNKLHADVRQGRTLDIILKKVKHRLVESMGNATADALGLSRAILCNDTLVQRLATLEKTENLYKGLVAHVNSVLHAFFDLFQIYKVFGDAFASMGVKEPQPRASEAFTNFGEQHRQMEKLGIIMLKSIKPILSDLGTYLNKAIPDTRMTISKYADAKFEYLSYCLKVKEMDDEEQSYIAIQEPLYRIETGNYEYRLILRCRQNARTKFARLRSDVLVKLELLDNKHVEDVVKQIQKFATGLAKYYSKVSQLLSENILFPVEIDLSQNAFQYKQSEQISVYNDDEEGEEEEEGACGFDPSKILDFDVAEEATPNVLPNAKSEFTELKQLNRNIGSKELADLNDLVDLNGLKKMNENFEQLLLLDDVRKPEADAKYVDLLKEEVDKSLLFLDEKDKASLSLVSLESGEQSKAVPELSAKKKNDSDSLLFLDIPNEPLINLEMN